MALRREIIDFCRSDLADDAQNAHRVAQVSVVQMKMRMALQMGNALAVVDGGAAYGAMHLVAFLQEKLGQIRTVLSGDTGDKCCFSFHYSFICFQRTA